MNTYFVIIREKSLHTPHNYQDWLLEGRFLAVFGPVVAFSPKYRL